MKSTTWKKMAALVLSVVLLGVNADALFGWRAKKEAAPNLPEAEDVTCMTYQGVTCMGELSADGGEELHFALVDEPRKGAVLLDGDCFVYTPKETAAGKDRFTYAAVDAGGNASLPAVVEIDIQKVRSGVTYADMVGNDGAVAAQYLAEEGVFVGSKLGKNYYFEPEREVLRSEFLAMALEAAEKEVTAVTLTGFCDDDAIPVWAKAYAAAGVAEGIVKGAVTENGNAFRAEEVITFDEAATVLDRVLRLEDVDLQTWYADRGAVPSWAAQAVANMESVQVLEAGSFGSLDLERPVCRADAAKMLSAVRMLLEERR